MNLDFFQGMQTVLFYAEKIEVFIKTQNNFSKPLQL